MREKSWDCKLMVNEIQGQDIRDAFFDQIYQAGSKDPNVIIITNDMDVFSLRKFKDRYPDRFINVGVAEQNMVNVAAGLASCGKKIIIYGITPFIIYRCFEQIKFNICSMGLPVVFVGVGAGLSFSYDGPTHHATHDIGALFTIPELEIYNPGDIFSSIQIANFSLISCKPTFVRIDKGSFPILNSKELIIDDSFSLLRPLQEINIIATGSMVSKAVEISDELQKMGISTGVVDLFKIKPISKNIKDMVLKKSKMIFTLEENSPNSGIAMSINAEALKENLIPAIYNFGTEDKQVFDYGDREWLLASMKLDNKSIINTIYNKCKLAS